MNIATVNLIYSNPNMIKSAMQVKRENNLVVTPRQATLDLVTNALSLGYKALSHDDLLEATGLSQTCLRNCLLYLVEEKKIIRRPISVYGSGFTYNYLLVRGDL